MPNWYRAEKDEIARVLGFADYDAAVIQLYAQNWSYSQIATIFHVTGPAIGFRYRLLGGKPRGRGGHNNKYPRPENDAEMIRLYADDWSLKKIGEKFGMLQPAVGSRLRRNLTQRP